MKRLLISIVIAWIANAVIFADDVVSDYHLDRLPIKEIMEGKTPASVAQNFVVCIYYSDTAGMLNYMTPEMRENYEEQRIRDGYSNYDPYFSVPDSKLNVKGWKNAIDQTGYEIAAVYVYDKKTDSQGRFRKEVNVKCVRTRDLNSSSFLYSYGGVEVDVILVNTDSGWKVDGVK